eukprot:273244-Pelagomonas_calceolata.AAC.3
MGGVRDAEGQASAEHCACSRTSWRDHEGGLPVASKAPCCMAFNLYTQNHCWTQSSLKHIIARQIVGGMSSSECHSAALQCMQAVFQCKARGCCNHVLGGECRPCSGARRPCLRVLGGKCRRASKAAADLYCCLMVHKPREQFQKRRGMPMCAIVQPHQARTAWVWCQVARAYFERMDYSQAAHAFETARQWLRRKGSCAITAELWWPMTPGGHGGVQHRAVASEERHRPVIPGSRPCGCGQVGAAGESPRVDLRINRGSDNAIVRS